MRKIQFTYEYPHTDWSVLHVFKKYHDFFIEQKSDVECSYVNASQFFDGNPSGPHSAQNMVITDLESQKYIIVSYWDRPIEMTWQGNGWNTENCIEIIATSGTYSNPIFTPLSYVSYSRKFDEFSLKAKSFYEKEKNELFFNGYLYGDRLDLSKLGKIDINNNKIHPDELYFETLTNNKICLSLNGVGEICNRDMEILSANSVLFRPKLKSKFHNDLIPDFHYIPFDLHYDPNIQLDIILEKYNQVKDDDELLSFICNNGFEWYNKNGTINANVDILKELVNIDKLI
jgi:hypothetical protein